MRLRRVDLVGQNRPVTSEQKAADFSVKPVLTGDKVILRPFSLDDLPTLAAILEDPEVLRYTGSQHLSFDLEQIRSAHLARAHRADRLDLAVIDKASGELVGEVVLNNWDPHNRSCNFRTLLGARGRDRGLGTEAIRLIVGYGFEHVHLHRISLDVFTFNPRARRVYEKVGFVVEGIEREALLLDNEWIDSVYMSLLDREWAAITAGQSQAS
jgi:RimJ/RimL family protein N-acetyltransferase